MKKNMMCRSAVLVLAIGILSLIISPVYSQSGANIWYFGTYIGLNFSTSPPTLLRGGNTVPSAGYNVESSASITDSAGNLVFFASGPNLYNGNLVLQGGGNTLSTTRDAAQGNLIIPVPGSKNQYYNFTVDAVTSTCCSSCEDGSKRGARYSIITAGTAGAITIGAEVVMGITATDSTSECQVGIPKANGIDYWWVIHDRGSNKFNVFSVTSTGVTFFASYAVGYAFTSCTYTSMLQVNTCYNKIGMTADGTVSLFDFDNATGIVSNSQQWTLADAYGIEFSTNNKYLYVSEGVAGTDPQNIYEYDVTSGVAATISSTGVSLGVTYGSLGKSGHLQLGPDGNIYVAEMSSYSAANYSQYIGVIKNINTKPASYTQQYITVSDGTLNQQQVTMGLPTILKSLLVQNPPSIVNDTLSKNGDTITVCPGQSFYLSYNFAGNTSSVLWKFGDGTTSTLLLPSHSYASSGFYTITLIITDNCNRKDSVVNYAKVPTNTTAGTLSCSGGNALVMTGTGPGKANYIWYTAATGGTVLGKGASVTTAPYVPATSAPNSVWVEDATGFTTYSALSTHMPTQQISSGSVLTTFTTSKSLTLVSVQAVPWTSYCSSGPDSVYFTVKLGATTVATSSTFPITCAQSTAHGALTFGVNIDLATPGTYTISYTMKTSVFTNYFQDDYYSAATGTSLSGVASIGTGSLANLYGSGPDSGPFYNFVFMDYSACATRLKVTRSCSLPVDFIYFKATPDGSSNLIEWATANEWNNDYFVLERSDDGINFTPVTKISGAGNSSQIQYYNYLDAYAQRGVVYYRLAQVDINGGTHYSAILSLNRNGDDLVKVAPNPFTDQTNLVFLTDVVASVRLLDLVGRVVATYEKATQDGILSIGSGLSKGTYIVQVVTDTQEHNYKIIKE